MNKPLGFVVRHISSIAFAVGFVWDTLTLTRIDVFYENAVFVSYLLIAFCGILLIHSVETGRWAPRMLTKRKEWLPALVQFPLGGMFSGFVIFYTKSASLLTSWPFLTLLLLLFVGNEFFRRRYERLVFQIGLLYFCLVSYLILVAPVVLGTLGYSTFALATLTSLLIAAVMLQVVMRLFPELYKRSMRGTWFAIGAVFCSFHALYLTNIIPPVPLALKDIGIYHTLAKEGTTYTVAFEAPGKYEFWRSTGKVFHRVKNGAAYCFSAVFAPTAIRTEIFHSWQRKNADGKWVREERVSFPIAGGREQGYRGYTIKRSLPEGEWRCVVETEDGKSVGETYFTVVEVPEPVALVTGAL